MKGCLTDKASLCIMCCSGYNIYLLMSTCNNMCDCKGLTEVWFNWHLELHTGEKTFICIICYYGDNSNLDCFGIRLAFIIFNINDG